MSSSSMTPQEQAAALKYLYGDDQDQIDQVTQDSSFVPKFINTPDGNSKFQSISSLSSSSAIPESPFLNRASLGLESSALSNPGNVELGDLSVDSVLNMFGNQTDFLKTFVPNVLDDYDQITYNFKLALAPETQLLNNDINPTGPFYIVAQSGVSASFYIKSVDIDSIVGPNAKTRNVKSTIFNMTIVEPQGISLIDKLIAAGKELNIKNFYTCPMILELSFKGYEKNGRPVEVNIARRTWRLQLNDIQTKMDHGGSEYNLSFINIADYAFNRFSSAAMIPQQISFPVDTVGQFFDDLGYFLTLRSTRIAQQGQVVRSEYEFNLDPTMRSWKIGEVPDVKNASSLFIDQDNKRNIVLSTNMTLDRIVDVVLATTKEGNEMINPDSNPEKMDQQPTAPKVSKIAQINGNIEYLGFNTKANDYIRKYVYYINKFDSFRALIDKPNQEDEANRVQYLLQDALKKKYEYIFTGKNTDVLNLDINLNNLWRHATIYYANSLHRKSNTTSKFIKKELQPTTEDDLRLKASTSQFAYTPIPGSTSDTAQYTPIPTNQQQNFTPIPGNLPPLNTSTTSSLDALSATSVVNQDALRADIAAQDLANEVVPVEGMTESISSILPVLVGGFRLNPSVSGQLIETLDSTNTQILALNQDEDAILDMFIKQVDPSLDPLRVTQNLEETTDTGRSIFGIIANQLYDNTVFSNLLKIELEIRGDPYWLGESDVEILNRLNSNSVEQTGNTNFANYLKGENCFFLTFKTPQNYNETTGFVDVKNSDLYIGVYSVIKVKHSFSDGKFVQSLEAIRDIQTSAKTLRQYIS